MNQNRLSTLLEMSAQDPEDCFVLYAIAKEYENLNSLDQALTYYLSIKEKDPSYIGVYYHLAKLYESLGRQEDAIQTYEDGIVVAKKLSDFHALAELNGAKLNLEMEA